MPKTYLPDVNIWLALAFDGHAHHRLAKPWFDALSDDGVCFCRLTQQGFLRLATNPSVFGTDALTLAAAWQVFDQFMSDPRVRYVSEPAAIEVSWRHFTDRKTFSPHVWNDAYLAAFALAAQMELVTLDQALTQYLPTSCIVIQ